MKPGSKLVSVNGSVSVTGEVQIQNQNILSIMNEQSLLITQMNETIQQQHLVISQMNDTIQQQNVLISQMNDTIHQILQLQQRQKPTVFASSIPYTTATVIPPGSCNNFLLVSVHARLDAGSVADYMGFSILTVLMNGNPINGDEACSGGKSDVGVWGRGDRFVTATGASFSAEFYYSNVNQNNTLSISSCLSNDVSYVQRAEYTLICF